MANKGPVWVDPGFSAKRQARKAARYQRRYAEGIDPTDVANHVRDLARTNRGWFSYTCNNCHEYLNHRDVNYARRMHLHPSVCYRI